MGEELAAEVAGVVGDVGHAERLEAATAGQRPARISPVIRVLSVVKKFRTGGAFQAAPRSVAAPNSS